MLNRRSVLRLSLSALATSVSLPPVSLAQDLQAKTAGEILQPIAEQIREIASNPALRTIYANLAYLQVQYRISTNFKGYENQPEFSKGALDALGFALFQEFKLCRSSLEGTGPSGLRRVSSHDGGGL